MALAGHRSKGSRFCVSATWATVTPESAEEGENADEGDDYDDEPFSRLSDVVSAVKDLGYWAHWAPYREARPGSWVEAEVESNYSTMAETSRSLHVRHCNGLPLRHKEAMFLHRRLRLDGELIPQRWWDREVAEMQLRRQAPEL